MEYVFEIALRQGFYESALNPFPRHRGYTGTSHRRLGRQYELEP